MPSMTIPIGGLKLLAFDNDSFDSSAAAQVDFNTNGYDLLLIEAMLGIEGNTANENAVAEMETVPTASNIVGCVSLQQGINWTNAGSTTGHRLGNIKYKASPDHLTNLAIVNIIAHKPFAATNGWYFSSQTYHINQGGNAFVGGHAWSKQVISSAITGVVFKTNDGNNWVETSRVAIYGVSKAFDVQS